MSAQPTFDYLWQYVDYWAAVDCDFPSIRYRDKTITAAEFALRVDQTAGALLTLGLRKGDRLVTVLPSIPEYVIIFLAAGKIGVTVAPMDVRYRLADYKNFIDHVQPKLIIFLDKTGDNDIAGILKSLKADFDPETRYVVSGEADFGVPFSDVLSQEFDIARVKQAADSLDPDDPSLIIFTGGETGVPKAALLSYRNVIATASGETGFLQRCLTDLGVTGRMKTLACLPPSHVGGTIEAIGTGVLAGLEMIMVEHWNPYTVLQITQSEKIPWMTGVPTMYAILLSLPDLGAYDLSSVRAAFLSGETVTLELMEAIRSKICDRIIVGYGSTEAGAEVTFTDLDDEITEIADGYVGTPLPGQSIKIVDENGDELPALHEGEILVRGPMTISGYLNMPEEDQTGFTADGWCRTGDLGYLTEDGGLYIKGRLKEIIRVGSYTVLPTEVEQVALQDPGVAMVSAVGIPHDILGEVIWLVVVPQPNSSLSPKALIKLCQNELADYKVPQKIIVRDSLPFTRLGKVDRISLRKELLKE